MYTVTATNSCGVASTSVNVTVNAAPVLFPLFQSGNYIIVRPTTSTDHIQWYYANNTIGTDDDTLQCAGDGTYFCIVTNADGCFAVSDSLPTLCTITGINTLLPVENISIYPNPVNNLMTVNATLLNDRYSVTIANTLGEIIRRNDNDVTNGTLNFEFRLDDVTEGVYFLTIYSTKMNRTLKFVKQ
jgi:hypothetical protein